MDKKALLRKLPKVDELLKENDISIEIGNHGRQMTVDSIREVIENYRGNILQGCINDYTNDEIVKDIKENIISKYASRFKKVINATGIVIHTNLGRSMLCDEAAANVDIIVKNYNNLEYNIEEGTRGSRYSHVEELICRVTGAEAAMVVNNNAAAVMLAMNTMCSNKQAIVSRGQLVEIGGSFRIPEVMKLSGAELVEVGTTNRTHLYDYERNINENTGAILKVHTSNFRITGFTEEVDLKELVQLGEKYNIPVIEDIGSGVFIDLSKYGISYEPTVQDSISSGVDIITFSGDKLLGGPQAGIIAGRKKYVESMKKNQLTRALRVDKMTLAALEGTLRCYLDEDMAVSKIPTLRMLVTPMEELEDKAEKLKNKLREVSAGMEFFIDRDFSMVGGGSMPGVEIETCTVKVKSSRYSPNQIENALRLNSICPVITRVEKEEVVLDVRTLSERDFDIIQKVFSAIDSNINV